MTIAYIMEKYVKPMIGTGQLALTILDKPKSKYQKYFTVLLLFSIGRIYVAKPFFIIV